MWLLDFSKYLSISTKFSNLASRKIVCCVVLDTGLITAGLIVEKHFFQELFDKANLEVYFKMGAFHNAHE